MLGDTLITPGNNAVMCAPLGMAEPELVSIHGNALTRDAKRRLRLVVHDVGWLNSMVLHGRRCRGYTTYNQNYYKVYNKINKCDLLVHYGQPILFNIEIYPA